MNEKATEKGVAEAFDWWLNQHPISMPAIVKDAIKEKFGEWLDEHTLDIIEKIAAAKGDQHEL